MVEGLGGVMLLVCYLLVSRPHAAYMYMSELQDYVIPIRLASCTLEGNACADEGGQ